jgi:hypothetical protein
LEFIVKKIGEVNGARGFAANNFQNARVRVAQSIHSDATKKIQVFLPVGIEHVGASPVSKEDWRTLVGWQQILIRLGEGGKALRWFTSCLQWFS